MWRGWQCSEQSTGCSGTPRMPRSDMEGAVADPIEAAYNTIKDAVDGVYDAMGGGE